MVTKLKKILSFTDCDLEVNLRKQSTRFFSKWSDAYFLVIRDTHKEKEPSNKTPALMKSTNKDMWVVGTSNQLYTRGS